MAQNNPYATYTSSKVTTASPAELTLMLYEGAIKFCNLAKKDFDLIYTYIFNLMVEVNTKQSMEALDEILQQLRELRDIWKQVMKLAKQPAKQSV